MLQRVGEVSGAVRVAMRAHELAPPHLLVGEGQRQQRVPARRQLRGCAALSAAADVTPAQASRQLVGGTLRGPAYHYLTGYSEVKRTSLPTLDLYATG